MKRIEREPVADDGRWAQATVLADWLFVLCVIGLLMSLALWWRS